MGKVKPRRIQHNAFAGAARAKQPREGEIDGFEPVRIDVGDVVADLAKRVRERIHAAQAGENRSKHGYSSNPMRLTLVRAMPLSVRPSRVSTVNCGSPDWNDTDVTSPVTSAVPDVEGISTKCPSTLVAWFVACACNRPSTRSLIVCVC